jgi:ubiquinone/menaquinone biosynthesis C-methylase UbiE
MRNADAPTVDGFGDEWTRFDQSGLAPGEARAIFDDYFSIFPWQQIPRDAVGFDAGCGSGRWARIVAPRVGRLWCVDASDRALDVARRNLGDAANVTCVHASIDEMPFSDESMDFGYSLGVLHHMPDVPAAIRACVRKLKSGAPLLLYLYYAFDNRPNWFRAVWRASDLARRGISAMPHGLRYTTSQVLAATVYWPLARSARVLESFGVDVDVLPLSSYRNRSFYVMRNDALDRFGTRLEQRFGRKEISEMMESAGLERIAFSDRAPYWCAVGYRR